MEIYLLDSNFFIQAHRVMYPLDIACSFWNKVKQLAEEGKIISVDKVKNELYDKNDSLEKWCKENLPTDFFKSTSGVLNEYSQILSWAVSRSEHYLPQAINEFMNIDEADSFLIAYALADPNNRFIVTQEISQPLRKNKIKIPDVCRAFNLRCVNTIDMFRRLGERF